MNNKIAPGSAIVLAERINSKVYYVVDFTFTVEDVFIFGGEHWTVNSDQITGVFLWVFFLGVLTFSTFQTLFQ